MILVTGATGLVGSHLVFKLTEEIQEICASQIRALYRSKEKIEKVKALFLYYDPKNGLKRFEQIQWKACDVLNIFDLQESFEGITKIYHCAAEVSFQRGGFS